MFRFDAFELDAHARELRRGPERVRLQAQPFELLVMMLERPGAIVTRDEMTKRLWPNGTFVDFEHSLNAAVKRLRAVLGDDAGAPRFVETLPRRGYRFIAPCTWNGRAAAGAARARVAVLPFTDDGREPRPHGFADGLTDEAIVQLGQLEHPGMEVIARASSKSFTSGACLARDIGTALRAEFLLEGSVRYHGEQARIAAWLVDTSCETPVWTGVFDRCVGDVLAVQIDVARRIAGALAQAFQAASFTSTMRSATSPWPCR